MEPLSHDALRDLLPDYAAGYLKDGALTEIETHLATCAECRAELAQWRTLAGWLEEAEAAIPPDPGAAPGLAAIHARLGRTAAGVNMVRIMERNGNHAMPYQDDSFSPDNPDNTISQRATQGYRAPGPALRERAASTGPAPRPPAPQRRIRPWLAVGSVAVFLALVVSLFYVLAPQLHPNRTAGNPTATPHPYVGSWHSAPKTMPNFGYLTFAPSAPRTGYGCVNSQVAPATSAQWLFKSGDGGMTWRPVAGITTPKVSAPAASLPAAFQCAVFVDASDANDVLAQVMLLANPNCSCAAGELPPLSETLWRSRDGGATWAQLQSPRFFRGWTAIIVAGSRLIGLGSDANQVPPTCGTTNPQLVEQINDLVASSDGGQTWKAIGQSIIAQGLSISEATSSAGGQLLQNNGATVVVHSYCEARQPSGVNTTVESDWTSTDGGATWTKLKVGSGQDVTGITFTPNPAGGTYGVAVDLGDGASQTRLPIIRSSADSGASWTALPSLSALPGAQTAGAVTAVDGLLSMPDGTVLASIRVNTLGATGQQLSNAIYVVDPHSASPAWTRYAPATGSIAPWAGSPLAMRSQGAALWGTVFDGQKVTLAYLSPLP